ncbi:MAG: von Willebrand factor type A domain-containing protein, partial [Anaerolineaceae bacterium]|nr:von Willebrand factor type A domain-containing protein [Anaerolineaceae bacterium]
MNTKRLFSIGLFLLLAFCAACAPAMAPNPIAQEPAQKQERKPDQGDQAARPELPGAPAPTAAPRAIQEEPVQPPPPDNEFKDYGVNPQTDTSYDHLSTFALDVDTASYNVARRYINDGSLPP